MSHCPLSLTTFLGKQFHYFLVYPSNVSFRKNKQKYVLFLLSNEKYTQIIYYYSLFSFLFILVHTFRLYSILNICWNILIYSWFLAVLSFQFLYLCAVLSFTILIYLSYVSLFLYYLCFSNIF